MSDEIFAQELKDLCSKYKDRKLIEKGTTFIILKDTTSLEICKDSDDDDTDDDESDEDQDGDDADGSNYHFNCHYYEM